DGIRDFHVTGVQTCALPIFDADLKRLAADMIETMYAADGVGLAAPQIGVSKRLFVALEVQPGADDDPDAEEGEVAAAERRRRWEDRKSVVQGRSGYVWSPSL